MDEAGPLEGPSGGAPAPEDGARAQAVSQERRTTVETLRTNTAGLYLLPRRVPRAVSTNVTPIEAPGLARADRLLASQDGGAPDGDREPEVL